MAPVLARDLRVGELYLAVPAALVILLLVFGTGVGAAAVPVRGGDDPAGARHRVGRRARARAQRLPAEHGADDRARHRDRLLAARRQPLPRRAPQRPARTTRRSTRRWLHAGRTIVFSGLAVSRRAGADAAAAGAVPARLRRRRARDPGRQRRLRADAAAGAAARRSASGSSACASSRAASPSGATPASSASGPRMRAG